MNFGGKGAGFTRVLRKEERERRMVRTKANHAATRKAVAARAPRKSVGVARPVCSPSGGKSRKGKAVIGGNPAKLWPTPEWQKGIGHFLPECQGVGPSPNSSLTSESDQQPGPSKDISPSPQDEMGCSAGGMGGVALLDSSITQLNSDDEDSD